MSEPASTKKKAARIVIGSSHATPASMAAAMQLASRAERRKPTEDDRPTRPSTFYGAPPPHIDGQLALGEEPNDGD